MRDRRRSILLVLLIAASCARADTFVDSEFSAESPSSEVRLDTEAVIFEGFPKLETLEAACAAAPSETGGGIIVTSFTGCGLTDSLDPQTNVLALTPESSLPDPADSSSLMGSLSLWLLGALAAMLAFISGQRMFGARHSRSSRR
jgi:hypothetical protein